jgi:hypothetical protein
MADHDKKMIRNSTAEFLIFTGQAGEQSIEARYEDETVWLTQQLMAELFQSSKQNISHHIRSTFEEGEQAHEATVKKYLTVRQEGNREGKRHLDYYSPDLIIPENMKYDVVNSFAKLIGIISHVSAMKERISTQINITPVSGGRSSLSGLGCTKVGGYPNG